MDFNFNIILHSNIDFKQNKKIPLFECEPWQVDEIEKAIVQSAKQKCLFKIRPTKKYTNWYLELKHVFLMHKRKHTDLNWLWCKGRNIYRQQQNDEEACHGHVTAS